MGIWSPSTTDTRLPFGLDISKYQGNVNFDRLVAYNNPKVDFVACRAAISWGYTDPWFETYWRELKARKIHRLAYHVVYPGESPREQVKKIFDVVGVDVGEGPLVLDVELDHGQSRTKITDCVDEMVRIIYGSTGRFPAIYTRPGWVQAHMEPTLFFEKVWWWMATYTYSGMEHNGVGVKSASARAGVPEDRVVIHQTSSKGQGNTFGMESRDLDYDRWWGTDAQLAEFFNLTPTPPQPPEERMKIEVRIPKDKAEVTIVEI